MKRLAHDINVLLNQILNKDGYLSCIEKYAKEIENIEKEIVDKNNAMSHANADISDLETKSKETRTQINDLQIRLRDTQQRVIYLLVILRCLSFISLLQRVTL